MCIIEELIVKTLKDQTEMGLQCFSIASAIRIVICSKIHVLTQLVYKRHELWVVTEWQH